MTLLDRLKAETRRAHDQIERTVDIQARTSSVSAYRDLLARFYGFHAVWEAEAQAIIADPVLLDGRVRTPLLVDDLTKLGVGASEIDALPLCAPVLQVPVLPEALGAMYVVKGSTLGGNIIAKHVERTLGFGAGSGCSYFRSYGANVGAMWKSFQAHLLGLSSPAIDGAVIDAANRTFSHMGAWLSGEAAA